ncbi:HAMP domain-containing histidine kinase [Hymenobacter aquaticus]|uniref:histidine kinase n=1 Tax=Hymenobacter aquaticus TaxID=1867101 RepID=A0A4Z0PVS3_9BACT|nr:HAMP domain-containing sensor histidine kinase [Hymenobacter aquaticus]TGE21394.1 HAMP domain-containing histidine kinase [Hymenobacter aquaticus]
MPRPASLRAHLLLAFTVVVLLTTLLGGGWQYRRLRALLTAADDDRLRARAQLLLARADLSGTLPVLALPDQAGETMRVTYEQPGRPAQELFRSAQWGWARPHGWRQVRVARSPGLFPDDQLTLWLAHPAAPLAASLRQVRQGLAAAVAGSLLLAWLLAPVLSRVALRSLRRISREARRMGRGSDLTELPVPATGDEVQELAETLNQLLARLRAGAELQDNFLAAAAHELRTPLATLQTGLSVASQAPDMPAAARAQLAGHQQEIRRLSRLVDDFLLVSRLRAGALPLSLQPVALDELVLGLADRLLPRFRAAGRPLTIHLDENAPDFLVLADADKLTTVVLNLLENALRHAPAGAGVTVSVSRAASSGWPTLTVQNPAQGSLGDLTRLTTAYYQADVLSEGAGLGLWLSSRIAELHGTALILSQPAGIFTAALPLPPPS